MQLGFVGPRYRENTVGFFELYYEHPRVGVSVEVNFVDRAIVLFLYNTGIKSELSRTYRDGRGLIQKRYLNEVLLNLHLINTKELQNHNKDLRKLALEFENNFEVLANDAAMRLQKWLPCILQDQVALFGMEKIHGAPANYYT